MTLPYAPTMSETVTQPNLAGNAARDARHIVELEAAGWTPLVIWECETLDAQRLAALAASIKEMGKHMGRKGNRRSDCR